MRRPLRHLLFSLLLLLGGATHAAALNLQCSTINNGKVVLNELFSGGGSQGNLEFVEIYFLQDTNISGWKLYFHDNNTDSSVVLGQGNNAATAYLPGGGQYSDNNCPAARCSTSTTFPAGTFIVYHIANISPQSGELLLADTTQQLTDNATVVVDHLRYYKDSSINQWDVPPSCGLTLAGHDSNNKDMGRMPNGTGGWVDTGSTPTAGATNTPAAASTLDHLRIEHDGSAYTCAGENITLKACADASCSTLYLGPVTVDLTNITDANWSSDPVTFSGGQATVSLTKTTAGTVTLGGTATSPTATNATAVCYNGAAQSCALTYTLTTACFDAVEVTQSASTSIHTKLAGTAFSLDVLAMATGFTGPVSVALVDPTALSGNCSDFSTGLTAEAAYTFLTGDNGRHTFNFNYPYAAKNVKVRIRNTSTNQSVCSTDNFAIRPLALTVNVNLGGTTLAAGNNFTMTAASGVSVGYTGTPILDSAKVHDHTNLTAGTLKGNFAAATGASATGTFQYHDVGTISLLADAVTDPSFTSVDQPADCIAASTSNTLASGKYGCTIGSSKFGPFGRFYPHHFTYTAVLTPSCAAGDFTYMGDANLGISLSLQARSADESVTARYTNGYTPIGTFVIAGDNSGTAIPVTRLSPALPAFTWNAGTYNYSHTALGDRATFARNVAPDGSYENFALKASVADPDGAALSGTNLSNTIKIRYGRLRLPNAYGPETEPIIMPARLEYYNGSTFALNTQDSCTNPGVIASYRLDNTLEVNQVDGTIKINGNASTTLTVGAINAGIINLTFSPPGSGKTGYADVTALIATPLPWLLYEWDGLDNDYNENPSARVNFGIYRGNDRIINWREIIR